MKNKTKKRKDKVIYRSIHRYTDRYIKKNDVDFICKSTTPHIPKLLNAILIDAVFIPIYKAKYILYRGVHFILLMVQFL